mmetsp:Transcript_12395/g.17611  ORF Transcript_12395/g.17611 Transcript_12395/m.17611 type:complete len:461 (+) Transcript_12395:93-1475(+)
MMDNESSCTSSRPVEQQEATAPCHHVPNKNLTPSQKKAKRALKKQLKLQQKRIKLETRLRHALSRKDAKVEKETIRELELLDQTTNKTIASSGTSSEHQEQMELPVPPLPVKSNIIQISPENNNNSPARRLVVNIYQKLQHQQHHMLREDDGDEEKKQEQHERSIDLLRHMTKGTQERSMFCNTDALWGYTRQKFFERAVLVSSSFEKLHPKQQKENENILLEEKSKRDLAWNRLCNVKNICSVGCGPGNDVVGVVAFLEQLREEQSDSSVAATETCLNSAVLMDWAMAEWENIVNPLKSVLVPHYIRSMETCVADITDPLFQSTKNREAQGFILRESSRRNPRYQRGKSTMDGLHVTLNETESETQSPQQESRFDLFLFSYILSEQRGLWHSFMKDLVGVAKQGALFYFSEPTPWQQHILCKTFHEVMDFIWLDSSMDFPLLQPLDNRVGPGVLLGMKR